MSRRVRSAGGGTGQPVGPVGQQARAEAEAAEHGLAQVYHVRDLVALSVSSVGPLFSIAATGGVMAGLAGWWTLPSILVIAVPFVIAAFVFRLLNRHFPHAGASYHWSRRVMGPTASRFQAWVLILAYFTSIPPIIIPAATYTIALVDPAAHPSALLQLAVSAGWVGFALIPLLGGARPTARITQSFLALELLAVLALAVIGALRWPALHVPVHFGAPPIGAMVTVAVVAATILDGWEIDSFASEESRRPSTDPGTGGIIGAFFALGFYALLYPLMFAETPLKDLAGADNPMAVWGDRLVPGAPWLMLIPVLASTAGGLWLTTYILSRALYSMGREGLLPRPLGRVNARKVPQTATLCALGAALAVVAAQLLFPSVSSFFGLVLSAAGFFLVAEFFLDSLTATVFLRRVHQGRHGHSHSHGPNAVPDASPDTPPHRHRSLLIASAVATTMFGASLVGFFVYGPAAIGSSIDYVLLALIGLGVLFTVLTRRHSETHHFSGLDVGGAAVPQSGQSAPRTPAAP
ncbi:APC family permease [Kitasatospora sp. NBC_01266]|uniref:APC family permease n=1 Tax=Kitasatospora sp. NBC_01266 TaxID=2903572 RepID=UPI002E35A017|nr:APC family permease [Kitasatospora sp. NBC_01266]